MYVQEKSTQGYIIEQWQFLNGRIMDFILFSLCILIVFMIRIGFNFLIRKMQVNDALKQS